MTGMARLLGNTGERVTTGDAAFDGGWFADGDSAIVQRVLDEDLRGKLVDLRKQVPSMRMASIEMMDRGLVVRWPGDFSPEWAAHLRGLALEIDRRLRGS